MNAVKGVVFAGVVRSSTDAVTTFLGLGPAIRELLDSRALRLSWYCCDTYEVLCFCLVSNVAKSGVASKFVSSS